MDNYLEKVLVYAYEYEVHEKERMQNHIILQEQYDNTLHRKVFVKRKYYDIRYKQVFFSANIIIQGIT